MEAATLKYNGFSKRPDFYNDTVKRESPEVSTKRYKKIVDIVLSSETTEEEKKQARQDACFYMKSIIRDMIRKKYATYIAADPGFAEDLEQRAYLNILEYLPKYSPEKGAPSTYFYFAIKNALSTETNSFKHHINSQQAALIRRIKNVDKEYEMQGLTPTVEDYCAELNKTRTQIINILKVMSVDDRTHLDNVKGYTDDIFVGNPAQNIDYEDPMKPVTANASAQDILHRVAELLSEDELYIFMHYILGKEKIEDVMADMYMDDRNEFKSKARNIKTILRNDPVLDYFDD